MAWCRQAPSHYLSQCWPRSMSPNGITMPQWVKKIIFFYQFDNKHHWFAILILLLNNYQSDKITPFLSLWQMITYHKQFNNQMILLAQKYLKKLSFYLAHCVTWVWRVIIILIKLLNYYSQCNTYQHMAYNYWKFLNDKQRRSKIIGPPSCTSTFSSEKTSILAGVNEKFMH